MPRGEGQRGPDDEVDALFRLSPPDFTAARNNLAARLLKQGRKDEAARVQSLPKPSISAWTVNQLFWRHRGAFEQLLSAGSGFRRTQSARLSGRAADVRGSLNELRNTLSELSRLAVDILQTSSGRAPVGVIRRVTATLEALASYESVPSAPRAGRLVDDVDPPGFDALTALVPRAGDGPRDRRSSRVLDFQKTPPPTSRTRADVDSRRAQRQHDQERRQEQRRRQLATATLARRRASRALAAAKKAAPLAQAALKRAAMRAKEAEREMLRAERRLQTFARRTDAVRQRARTLAATAQGAAQAVVEAEVALRRAERTIEDLRKP